jgi:hypothetical protein
MDNFCSYRFLRTAKQRAQQRLQCGGVVIVRGGKGGPMNSISSFIPEPEYYNLPLYDGFMGTGRKRIRKGALTSFRRCGGQGGLRSSRGLPLVAHNSVFLTRGLPQGRYFRVYGMGTIPIMSFHLHLPCPPRPYIFGRETAQSSVCRRWQPRLWATTLTPAPQCAWPIAEACGRPIAVRIL